MRLLIIDTYYKKFIDSLRLNNPDISGYDYKTQLNFLLSQMFGTSDFYSKNLNKLGHKAVDIVANDEILQRQWALENGFEIEKSNFFSKIQQLPFIHKFIGRPDWVQKIALEQIKKMKPNVIYMQDLSILNPDTLKKARKYTKLLVGQIACPLPNVNNLKQFDLILTSFPHYIDRFAKMGIKSEYFKIGFEKRVLNKIGKLKKKYEVTFIGGISPSHKKGIRILNYVASRLRMDAWGYGKQYLQKTSALYKYHHGEAWALDMYKLLGQSKITINRHIDVAENFANNMRLYEATGMGAMLITDKKDNLKDIFNVGEEVVEYTDKNDLVKKIKYYLNHENERSKIAMAGQKRTLRDHTYLTRMKELIKILNKYVQ